MPASSPIKILVAPLDWGLGHTTRCIPVITKLLEKEIDVVLAGNSQQREILLAEFPGCTFLELQGYNIAYSRSRQFFATKIMSQLPGVSRAIRNENRWLKRVVAQYGIHGVISDNRFGLYHSKIPTAIITHQLHIKTGAGALLNNWARQINYRQIRKFGQCWIPDYKEIPNLAGELSHPTTLPKMPVVYVGPLSRMTPPAKANKTHDLLFVISGPEPQRTIFEDLVFKQLQSLPYTAKLVRGLPANAATRAQPRIEVYNHLPKKELEQAMAAAELVICRSGYTSVMDINSMKLRSVLVPTPGQGEQEYLADYLMEQGFALKFDQSEFHLEKIINAAGQFAYTGFVESREDLLAEAIHTFTGDCLAKASHPL